MMNKQDLIFKLGEQKGATDSAESKLRIDNILDILNIISEEDLNKLPSIKEFEDQMSYPHSALDNHDFLLVKMLNELRAWKNDKQRAVKETALCQMRKSRKGGVVAAIVILAMLAGIAVTLGILSAFQQINSVWCDIVGVADCTFGIVFFIYELCDDKIKESEINAGNQELICKYGVKTGNIKKSGKGSSNVTGIVQGNISVGLSADQVSELFKKS